MIAVDRHVGDDHLDTRRVRHELPGRQLVPHDGRPGFRVEIALVERDAGATGSLGRRRRAKANDRVGLARVLRVAHRDEEAARGWPLQRIVFATPRVDVHVAIGGDDNVARVADGVGEHGRAEARGKRDATVIAGALPLRRSVRGGLLFGLLGAGERQREEKREIFRHGRVQSSNRLATRETMPTWCRRASILTSATGAASLPIRRTSS
jgi:hypothetical protein